MIKGRSKKRRGNMCTALVMQSGRKTNFLARTLDFSYPLEPGLYLIPRGRWRGASGEGMYGRYASVGIGQEIPELVLTDGVNEKGLAAAALYFPGYACYERREAGRTDRRCTVAATDLVRYLLGCCASVGQLPELLGKIRLIGVKDAVTGGEAPLHWIVTDKSGSCCVIERTEEGMRLWKNEIGVLTNSPDFPWHRTNLRNYMNLEAVQKEGARWGETELLPFGQGQGAAGLPGDYTPPARFVRAAFLRTHIWIPDSDAEMTAACFHVLEPLSIPKGVVLTERGAADYTQYTAVINTETGEYAVRTYSGGNTAALAPLKLWAEQGGSHARTRLLKKLNT